MSLTDNASHHALSCQDQNQPPTQDTGVTGSSLIYSAKTLILPSATQNKQTNKKLSKELKSYGKKNTHLPVRTIFGYLNTFIYDYMVSAIFYFTF